MAKKTGDLPANYNDAIARLRGRSSAFLTDGRMAIRSAWIRDDKGEQKGVAIIDSAVRVRTYWIDGSVEDHVTAS